jgi:hypothetical protein
MLKPRAIGSLGWLVEVVDTPRRVGKPEPDDEPIRIFPRRDSSSSGAEDRPVIRAGAVY